jgi:hypothetical protein
MRCTAIECGVVVVTADHTAGVGVTTSGAIVVGAKCGVFVSANVIDPVIVAATVQTDTEIFNGT